MVSSISGTGSAFPPEAAPPTKELGRDSFVRLLLTQLQSQDPTAPQSSEAFVAQLAQFTTVELLERQAGHMEALLVAQAAGNQTAVAGLVGKDVSFRADSITTTTTGEVRDFSLEVPSSADAVIVSIKDEDGRVVRTMNLGPRAAGRSDLAFDGLSDKGTPLPPGTYSMEVIATKNGVAVDASLLGRGSVSGVSFLEGVAELLVDGRRIRLPDVVEINVARDSN
jgi:flagellar basal-body rod modification protein FlgD